MSFLARIRGNKRSTDANSSASKNTYGTSQSELPDGIENFGSEFAPQKLLLKSASMQEIEKGDLGASASDIDIQTSILTCSRLSKTLCEMIHDRDALPYFIQFMESKDAAHFVRFWLDAESFQASSLTRVRSRCQISLGRNPHVSSHNKNNQSSSVRTEDSTQHARIASNSCNDTSANNTPHRTENISSASNYCDNKMTINCGTNNAVPLCKHSANSESSCDISRDNNSTVDFIQCSSDNNSNNKKGLVVVTDQGFSQSNCNNSSSLSDEVTLEKTLCGNNNAAHGWTGSTCVLKSTTGSQCDASNTFTHSKSTANFVPGAEVKSGVHLSSCVQGGARSKLVDIGGNSMSKSVIKPADACLNNNNDNDISNTPSRLNVSKVKTPGEAMEAKLLQNIAKDAVSIFSKYIAKDATNPIGITEEMRAETIRKICREDGLVDPQSFSPCQEFVLQIMNERYHGNFIISEYHSKHQIDILTGSKVYLADVLYNDNAFSYFMQYMEQEGAMPLIQCWMELDNFQQLLVDRQGQYDPMVAQNDAMIIYDKYFSLQATQPLGFSDKIHFEVEANICQEEGPLPDCFAKAKKIAVHALDREYFALFMKSAIFYKYLQDLINSVQLADIPSMQKKMKIKDADTDTASEHSIESQSTHSDGASISGRNTLLATGMSKALSKMDDNMQIDYDLMNPDKLWKRPQAGHMSLGRIDELGNFISEIDTGTAKREGFFSKKSREKEKTQEEMAAQIAQMIIKDCTPTMPSMEK